MYFDRGADIRLAQKIAIPLYIIAVLWQTLWFASAFALGIGWMQGMAVGMIIIETILIRKIRKAKRCEKE